MMGTSIQDLAGKSGIRDLQNMEQGSYSAGQRMQHEQGHNAAHNMHQAQQVPYYDMESAGNYPQFIQPPQQPTQYLPQQARCGAPSKEPVDIEELAKDINDSLTEDTFASVSESGDDSGSSSMHLFGSLPVMLREPLLILILFVLLSQAFVKDNLGKYIKQINPDMEGKVSLAGVVIYGIVLATLYAVAKKYIL